MHFSCDKKELLKLLNIVTKAVAAKSLNTMLEHIHIEAGLGKVTMKCTDLVLSIKSSIAAEVREEGVAAVGARFFHEIVNKYPDGEIVIETTENSQLSITCGNSNAVLSYVQPDEFPDFPEISKANPVKITENLLRKMINQTIFSSAISEDRPILTGALFEVDGDSLSIVALDGYRLALRKETVETANKAMQAVIPSKSLRETSRILGDTDDGVNLYFGEKAVLIENGDTEVYTRLLEGDFIMYKKMLPQEYKTRIKAETDAFCVAIERASILSREEHNNLIKITVKEDRLAITANSEIGRAYEEIPIMEEGRELEIAFNAKYLTDVLKNVEDTEIQIDFNSNISPCVLKPVEGDGFLYLVLPVQIRG